MKMITYDDALKKIEAFGKFGSKLGLERMENLMEYLGHPEKDIRVIHVAGTNGKGSVCRYLYEILLEAGYSVGLYTSPYLEEFTERIELNGKPISREDLASCTEKVLEQVEQMLLDGCESPTEFEVITAIAFLYYSHKAPDFLVLEVGLGGRGDSTNVVSEPLVSVITSISFDHTEYLGDTLEKIATEKAGIIKEGRPVVFAIKDEGAAKRVADIAKAKNAETIDVFGSSKEGKPALASLSVKERNWDGYGFAAEILGNHYTNVHLCMMGMHQVENASVALCAVEILKRQGVKITEAAVYGGLKKARQTGRFEILQTDPYVIIDGAHNHGGALALRATLQGQFSGKKLLLIVGMLRDKEIEKMIEVFLEIGATHVAATEPDNPRKLSSTDLCEAVKKAGSDCEDLGDWKHAAAYAKAHQREYDGIVFAGSLYLVGRIRGLWQ